MERIPLARDRWVRFARPMYISDKRAINAAAEAARDDPDGLLLDLMAAYAAVLEPAVEGRSWDGPFDALTEREMVDLVAAWAMQTEDDALPPASGTD